MYLSSPPHPLSSRCRDLATGAERHHRKGRREEKATADEPFKRLPPALVAFEIEGTEHPHERPDARAADRVDRHSGVVDRLHHAEVGEPARPPPPRTIPQPRPLSRRATRRKSSERPRRTWWQVGWRAGGRSTEAHAAVPRGSGSLERCSRTTWTGVYGASAEISRPSARSAEPGENDASASNSTRSACRTQEENHSGSSRPAR